ncbi:MAG: LysE family translocator [Gemmobacter sp.]|uniref:LysE family translocator n=1 Tax=Gemmobacter sp. TaxID=1898957 RepID=UPI001A45BBAC|nr:LysE family translocator [Gemmobacter sp.]MBL8562419.1 LysE family translocator [Gemmobacter sp.]
MTDLFTLIPPAELAAFLAAGIVLNLTPGADVMFATASGLQGGARAGAVAGLGVGLGGLLHVTLAVLGVSALLAASPAALTALKWAGAGYLLYLAVKSWRAGAALPGQGEARAGRALWRGFVTNALNPKVALFILSLLPQFTDPARGPVWQQILILGLLFMVTGTIITCGYGLLAGMAGQALGRRMGALNKLAALLYGALALRIVRG